jgi:hypothetical protein
MFPQCTYPETLIARSSLPIAVSFDSMGRAVQFLRAACCNKIAGLQIQPQNLVQPAAREQQQMERRDDMRGQNGFSVFRFTFMFRHRRTFRPGQAVGFG